MTPGVRVVLHQAGEAERKLGLLQALLAGGYAATVVGEDGGVAPVDDADVLVLHDGSEPALTHLAASEGDFEVHVRDVAGLDAGQVVELARDVRATEGPEPGAWMPWFPVIDYDRCTNCMQCLSFCLFGVYDVDDEKKIEVREPQKCKTLCPACSRVCPEVAILFPKYKAGPINGAEVSSEDVEREKMKTDISSLLGGDIYSLLRERHQRAESRFSKERDDERALAERRRCLRKLQEELDIPENLLDELPSAAEIQARFEERLAKRGGPA